MAFVCQQKLFILIYNVGHKEVVCMENEIKTTIRISSDVLEKLRVIAEHNQRSVSAEIRFLIDNHIKANQDILDKQQSSKH